MIPFLDLRNVNLRYQAEIDEAVLRVVRSGRYLQGEAVSRFESNYAAYIGTRYAVGCANGLDALTLIYRAYIETGRMKPGDEVIVPANTFIASILALTENGLVPVLCEPNPETLEIDDRLVERLITSRTRSLLLVHLYGRLAYTERIEELCRRYHLLLVEDNAQAHGCRYGERRTGSLGAAAGHSFYPGKNLGAMGDGGCVTTDDEELANTVRTLGNYGASRKYIFPYCGRNSRLDELQAAVLDVKLKHLDEDNARRQAIARIYYEKLSELPLTLPQRLLDAENVYHLFPVLAADRESRDRLQTRLAEQGVATLIHYPVPPHRQACYADLFADSTLPLTEQLHDRVLSLPISPAMTEEDAMEVVKALRNVL